MYFNLMIMNTYLTALLNTIKAAMNYHKHFMSGNLNVENLLIRKINNVGIHLLYYYQIVPDIFTICILQ